jgi:hypothetical protein
MLLRLIEMVAMFLIIWTGLSQVIVPFFRGTKLFPIFRREEKLEEKLAEANQSQVENELERKIDQTNRFCESCDYPAARICTNKESPKYTQEVSATSTCSKWKERKF